MAIDIYRPMASIDMTKVVDADTHVREQFDLFERYLDKKFNDIRPRVVGINDEPNDERWLVEGRIVPRAPFSRGVDAGGFRYGMKIHPNMKAKYNSLEDVDGRRKDLN